MLDSCTLSQGLGAYEYVVLSSAMPKPIRYSSTIIGMPRITVV